MGNTLLLDTSILVDFLRGKKAAVDFLTSLDQKPTISTLTVAELFAGIKGKKEMIVVDDFLDSFSIFPIDADIAKQGSLFKNQYFKSQGVGLADAIIAATATKVNATLVTLNQKHFPMLTALIVPYS